MTVGPAKRITGTIGLSCAVIAFDSADSIDLEFVSGDGGISVDGDDVSICIENGVLGEETVLMVQNLIGSGNVDTDIVFEGSVYVVGRLGGVDTVVVNGDLRLVGAHSNFEAVSVDVAGSVSIAYRAYMIASEALTVPGSIVVEGGTLVSQGIATVHGSVEAGGPDSSTAVFGRLFIGIDGSFAGGDSIAADASVRGSVDVDMFAAAAPGATVPEAFGTAPYGGTELAVDGEVFMTVYAKASADVPISYFDFDKDEAVFEGWCYTGSDGEEKGIGDERIGAVPSVYAKFITDTLLIVLVVLIVIMAILVVLRMMRS